MTETLKPVQSETARDSLEQYFERILDPKFLSSLHQHGRFTTDLDLDKSKFFNKEIIQFLLHGNPEELGSISEWQVIDSTANDSTLFDATLLALANHGIDTPGSPLKLTHIAAIDNDRLTCPHSHQLKHVLGIQNTDTSSHSFLKVQTEEAALGTLTCLKALTEKEIPTARAVVYKPSIAEKTTVTISETLIQGDEPAPSLLTCMQNGNLHDNLAGQLAKLHHTIQEIAQTKRILVCDLITPCPRNICVDGDGTLVAVDADYVSLKASSKSESKTSLRRDYEKAANALFNLLNISIQ